MQQSLRSLGCSLRSTRLFEHVHTAILTVGYAPNISPKNAKSNQYESFISILAVFHSIPNGIKHNTHRAAIARTTLGRSASV
jgi:hypothetical protein